MPAKGNSSSENQPVTRKEFRQSMKKIDERFGKIDERFGKIDERFERIDERFERIDERFERIDERFGRIDERFDGMTGEFVKLTSYIDQKAKETLETSERHMGVLFEEMIHRLETSLEFATILPPKIENHEERLLKVEEEIPALRLAVQGK